MPLTNITIPTEKLPPTATEPTFLVLYARPKAGKTTILSDLPGVIIDTQDGSKSLWSPRINLRDEYAKAVANGFKWSIYTLFLALLKDIKEKSVQTLIIDTFGDVEDWVVDQLDLLLLETAKPDAKLSVEDFGRKAVSRQLTCELPHGAGWEKIRQAVRVAVAAIQQAAPRIILVCHMRDKVEEKTSRVSEGQDLDLRGKVRSIVAGLCDALCFLVKNQDKCILTFRAPGLADGCRFSYLDGKEFVISEKQKDGTIKTYWERVFPSLTAKSDEK